MKLHQIVLVSIVCDAIFWVGLLGAATLVAAHYDKNGSDR